MLFNFGPFTKFHHKEHQRPLLQENVGEVCHCQALEAFIFFGHLQPKAVQ